MTPLNPRPVRPASAPVPVPAASPQPQPLAVLFQRLDEYARAAPGAFAQNTERALAADTRVFAAWCGANGHAMLPASPETIAAFIDAQADLKVPATVARNTAAPPAQAPRLIDLRDAALIATAYDTLLRRSELVSLRIEDLQRAPDGSATILVRRTRPTRTAKPP